MTHWRAEVDMSRSDEIEGSATPTIETSSASRNSAAQRTRMSPQARGPKRAAAAAPGRAETDTGDAPCGEVERALRSRSEWRPPWRSSIVRPAPYLFVR